ncbi:cysteine desulfurase family protein [Paenibacillus bovis]|uniref:cysteine desulfurase n=1 Tax=Paenibacillus bovis TaxID=1616788 RepID=A0A172ZKE8_9BACL|nr:cysteine desulfurase family protein [Paenibacillus bovis]ANF98013.1 cysteine desulfurase NifS [Paenibacillus bovis]
MKSIYLDHAASTPVHPEVAQTMVEVMTGTHGNASSVHSFGRAAKRIVSSARDNIAARLGCHPNELVFTAGGTESDNMALFGTAEALREQGRHIITSQIEHHAVLHACAALESRGYEVTYLPVDATGRVNPDDVQAAIRPDTILISIMFGNNEVGTLQPITEIGNMAREHGVVFHTDAVQALGAVPINCSELPVDLISFSSHKINGPQGIGALYVRQGTKLEPLLHGGLQERKRRAGTENLAGIAGFGKAVELATDQLEARQEQLDGLRRLMIEMLEQEAGVDAFVINTPLTHSLPHILNISFPGVNSETMLMNLDMESIAAASGSACTSGSLEISHVLQAMNLSENVLHSAIRFSFGMGNTREEIERTAQKIATILKRVRK